MSKKADRRVLTDLVGEFIELSKYDEAPEVEEALAPTTRLCADYAVPDASTFVEGLEALVVQSAEGIDSPEERRAILNLLTGQDRWSPLSVRGAAAAAELGITYDALRRRNRSGDRRLDGLMRTLANSVLAGLPEGYLTFEGSAPSARDVDPGVDVFDRATVFLSYSRADDEHEGGLVSALRERLISEFRFQTGQELFVFHDQSSIELGESWKDKIDLGIDTTSILLVLLTPSYLRSQACRAELERFFAREEDAERNDLVLPIYYATVPPSVEDDLARRLLGRQYVDWRSLRFEAFDSVPVRSAVSQLAASVAAALSRSSSTAPPIRPATDQIDHVEPGLNERLAEMQFALPRFVRTLMTLTEEQQGVTDEVSAAARDAERANTQGKGAAARVLIARRLTEALEPYADRMEVLADSMRDDLTSIEAGIQAMARELPLSDEEGIEATMTSMVQSLRDAHVAAASASDAVDGMSTAYAETARLVSTLKPVIGRMLSAVRVMQECPDRFASWIEALERGIAERVLPVPLQGGDADG